MSLTTLCAELRKCTTRRTSSKRCKPGQSRAVGATATAPGATGVICSMGVTPKAANTAPLKTRLSSVAAPCTSTGNPARASSSASSGVSTGSLRAPL